MMVNNLKDDTESASDAVRSGENSTQASQYVRFALSQLAGGNGGNAVVREYFPDQKQTGS
jgi:hypothetical protein